MIPFPTQDRLSLEIAADWCADRDFAHLEFQYRLEALDYTCPLSFNKWIVQKQSSSSSSSSRSSRGGYMNRSSSRSSN